MFLFLRISLRYLFSKRKEKFISIITWLAISGVAVSVMALIIVISVMSGFHDELKSKILGVGADINITDYNGIIYDYQNLFPEICSSKYVKAAAPYIAGQVIVRAGNRITGVHLRGIDSSLEPSITKVSSYLKEGVLPEKGNQIAIGKEFAHDYGLKIGSIMQVYSPTPIEDNSYKSIKKALAEITDVEVVGIFNTGMYEYDAALVYVPLGLAQALFALGNGVHGINILIEDPDLAYLAKTDLQKIIRYPYIIKGWMDINRNIFSALQTEKRVMFLLLILAVIVSGTNIISTLIMMVMEKTKDIGILKSIGAANFGIGSIFIFLGSAIGILGTSIGVGLGLAIVYRLDRIEEWISQVFGYKLFPPDIYYFDKIPVKINFFDIFTIALCAIILSILSAWYPAWKAGRLSPVDAIRYE